MIYLLEPGAHCLMGAMPQCCISKIGGFCAEGISPVRVSLSKAATAVKERGGPLPPPSPVPPAGGSTRRLSNDGSVSNSSAGSRRGTRDEPGIFTSLPGAVSSLVMSSWMECAYLSESLPTSFLSVPEALI